MPRREYLFCRPGDDLGDPYLKRTLQATNQVADLARAIERNLGYGELSGALVTTLVTLAHQRGDHLGAIRHLAGAIGILHRLHAGASAPTIEQ